MAQDRTSGFDMLVQINEAELNSQIATAFASGMLFPMGLSAPVATMGVTGRLDLTFDTPVADLDRPAPQLGLTIPFKDSQLEITSPVPTTIAPLSGTIVIVDRVEMRTNAGTQQAVMEFTNGAPNVTVTFDAATQAMLASELAPLGISPATAAAQMGVVVRDTLVNDVIRLPLTPAIQIEDDSDPLTPYRIEVTTVNDTNAADRDALTFGLRTSVESGGNINGITQSFIPPGSRSVLMMSNYWLLARVLRPRLASQLGLPLDNFDTPLRLNRTVDAPGGEGRLTDLIARVDGNRIRVDGRATASGTGWSAVATFHFFIDLSISNGAIQVQSTTPQVNNDIDLDWWVWLTGAVVGGIVGGIVGAIAGVIVVAIVEAVANGIAASVVSDGLIGATGSIPPIPLGPIGSGLTLQTLLLDDLELHGPINSSLHIPIKSSGQYTATGGAFTLDLDAGITYSATSTRSSLDLAWNPATGLDVRNGARIRVTATPYGSLTPVRLRQFSYGATHLAPNQIPISIDFPLFGAASEIVFGVRTNEGRLAKVRAYRDLMNGTAMRMHWVTYDTPVPTLDIALRWSVASEGASHQFLGHDFGMCTRTEVSRRCTVEAWPRLMRFPVDYQWCLCGTVLEKGKGEVQKDGNIITYEVDGRYLTLETEVGKPIDCELCVSAIDARGFELFTCTRVKAGGFKIVCGGGRHFYPKPEISFMPCDPLIAIERWEAFDSPRVQEHFQRALASKASPVRETLEAVAGPR